jgi:hypothetical protein
MGVFDRLSVTAGVAAVWVGSAAAVVVAQPTEEPIRPAPEFLQLTSAFTDYATAVSTVDVSQSLTGVQIALMIAQIAPTGIADMVAHPDQAAGTLNNMMDVGEAATYGTVANGADIPAGVVGPSAESFPQTPEFPGEFTQLVPSIASDSEEAGRAEAIDELNKAGAPTVVATSIIQSHRIGVTGLQAQGLVRSASLDAVQGVVTAATHRGDVKDAVRNGVTGVRRSLFGDSSLAGQPGGTVADPDTGAQVSSTRKLGAIKTVTTGLKNAGTAVTTSLKHDVSTTSRPRTGS